MKNLINDAQQMATILTVSEILRFATKYNHSWRTLRDNDPLLAQAIKIYAMANDNSYDLVNAAFC